MRLLVLLLSMLVVSACATTSDSTSSDTAMAVSADAPRVVDQGEAQRVASDDVVCRIEAPTGTRMRERVCRTQAEWDAIMDAGQERIRHRQSTGYQRY
jgi:hypothetical protein